MSITQRGEILPCNKCLPPNKKNTRHAKKQENIFHSEEKSHIKMNLELIQMLALPEKDIQ